MSELGRAFVAVVPPSDVFDAIGRAVDPLRSRKPDVRWALRGQWHFTLQFLGRVADDDTLVAALRAVTAGAAPFEVELEGAGAYPSAARAKILWIGVGAGANELTELAASVASVSEGLGHAVEHRPYTPHLTVARVPRPHRLDVVVADLAEGLRDARWTVDALVLVESDTRPGGAVHTERHRLPLGS